MSSLKLVDALRKTIELVLQKLNMVQDEMNELSREELLEITDEVNPKPVEVGDNLEIFDYTLNKSTKIINILGFKDIKNDMGRFNDVIIYPKYMVDGEIYSTQLLNLGHAFVNPHLTSLVIKDGVLAYGTLNFSSFADPGTREVFYNDSLVYLDVSGVSSINNSTMMFKFAYAPLLSEINLDFKSVIKLVSTPSGMFAGLTSLEKLDLTMLDLSECTSISRMFENCSNLKEILVSRNKWASEDTCSFENAFVNCGVKNVTYVD